MHRLASNTLTNLTAPLGETSCGLYVHSALQGDEALVYTIYSKPRWRPGGNRPKLGKSSARHKRLRLRSPRLGADLESRRDSERFSSLIAPPSVAAVLVAYPSGSRVSGPSACPSVSRISSRLRAGRVCRLRVRVVSSRATCACRHRFSRLRCVWCGPSRAESSFGPRNGQNRSERVYGGVAGGGPLA